MYPSANEVIDYLIERKSIAFSQNDYLPTHIGLINLAQAFFAVRVLHHLAWYFPTQNEQSGIDNEFCELQFGEKQKN